MNDDDKLAEILGIGASAQRRGCSWGKVASIGDSSLEVVVWSAEDGSEQTVKVVRCCNASAGDVVALDMVNGKYRAIARKGGSSSFTETDPTVPAWAKEAVKPTYEIDEIVGYEEIVPIDTAYIDAM